MFTIKSDSTGSNRSLVYSGSVHVGTIIERGITGKGRDRTCHVNVITRFDNRFVGSMEEAMDAIRSDFADTELAEAV